MAKTTAPSKAKSASAKPTYLGLLNAVSVAESAAAPVFAAWADTTKDTKLEKVLRIVAMREGEHGIAFAKRMLELGYEVRAPADPGNAEALKFVASSKTDVQKLRMLNFAKAPGGQDVFDTMFADKTIDPVTGGLLGRYIAEERNTGWLLFGEYERLVAKEKAAKKTTSSKKSKVSKKSRASKK